VVPCPLPQPSSLIRSSLVSKQVSRLLLPHSLIKSLPSRACPFDAQVNMVRLLRRRHSSDTQPTSEMCGATTIEAHPDSYFGRLHSAIDQNVHVRIAGLDYTLDHTVFGRLIVLDWYILERNFEKPVYTCMGLSRDNFERILDHLVFDSPLDQYAHDGDLQRLCSLLQIPIQQHQTRQVTRKTSSSDDDESIQYAVAQSIFKARLSKRSFSLTRKMFGQVRQESRECIGQSGSSRSLPMDDDRTGPTEARYLD
jgi:hypothetical protein